MRQFASRVGYVLVAVAVLAGCSPSAGPSKTTLPTPGPAAPQTEKSPSTPSAPAAPAIGMQDLVGVWRGSGSYRRFDADGTFHTATAIPWLEHPEDEGQYELMGDRVILHSAPTSQSCPGQTGTYELDLVQTRLTFRLVADDCQMRAGWDPYGYWERVSVTPTP